MANVVYTVGDDVSTDAIYPGRFMATVLPTETPLHCFHDDHEFNTALVQKQVPRGGIVVGGQNFGCGSSREQAASALHGHGLVVVAKAFARIFLQNSINVGLHMVICPGIDASVGDNLDITPTQVRNLTTGKDFAIVPLPAARQVIIDAGGLIPYTRTRLLAAQGTSRVLGKAIGVEGRRMPALTQPIPSSSTGPGSERSIERHSMEQS